MAGKGEFALIDWIRRHQPAASSLVSIGIGDDLAGLKIGGEELLFGCDQVVDGVHFRLAECGPAAAGRKALARNLSDVAAMAALPVAAVASVCLPNAMSTDEAHGIVKGMWDLAEEFDCPVVGGDVASWDGRLVISVSILARAGGVKPVRRSGAHLGDIIMVTGELGGAILGKHLSFRPLVREARALAEAVEVHAMIDISDGLAVDLHHIISESGCGARIMAEKIPVSQAARELAKRENNNPLEHSISDGEDYELLFAVSAKVAAKAEAVLSSAGVQVSLIGQITEGSKVIINRDRQESELPARGFEHFK